MALGIRPTDALVHRLLQQSQHAGSNSSSGHNTRMAATHQNAVEEQVNISPEAKRAAARYDKVSSQEQAAQSKYGQEDLEARLLSLYSHGTKG